MEIKGMEINGRIIDDTTLSNLPIGSSAKDLADLLSDANTIKPRTDEARPQFALSTTIKNSLYKLGLLKGIGDCEDCENCGKCKVYKVSLPRNKQMLIEHNPEIEGYTGILSN